MNELLEKRQIECSKIIRVDISKAEQSSEEWFKVKLGVVSASKAHILLSAPKLAPFPDDVEIEKIDKKNRVEFKGQVYFGTKADCKKWVREQLPTIKSEAWIGYINELVAEIATKRKIPEIKAKPLAWGKEYEDEASEAYSACTFETVSKQAFIFPLDSMRYGASPDGLIDGLDKGLELKCPYSSAVWVDFTLNGKIKKEEIAQVQFSMYAAGFKSWAFAKYDPRNINCKQLHTVEIKRDEKMMKLFDINLKEFICDMDHALDKLGLKFGDQWKD